MDLLKYNSLYYRNKSVKKIWLFIICFLGCLILIFYNIEYKNYYINSGFIIDNYTVKTYVAEKDLEKIINNKNIEIKGETFAYEIKSISNILFNSIYYREIIFDVDLKNNMNIKDSVIEFKILLDKKTILEYIFYKIGG